MIPGMNVYKMASEILGRTDYVYFAADGRALDDRGIWAPTFAAGVPLKDSIQPLKRSLYSKMGLDFDKYYISIVTDSSLLVVERGTSGGQIEYQGDRYQLLSNTDWAPIDGWSRVLAIRLNAVVPA